MNIGWLARVDVKQDLLLPVAVVVVGLAAGNCVSAGGDVIPSLFAVAMLMRGCCRRLDAIAANWP